MNKLHNGINLFSFSGIPRIDFLALIVWSPCGVRFQSGSHQKPCARNTCAIICSSMPVTSGANCTVLSEIIPPKLLYEFA